MCTASLMNTSKLEPAAAVEMYWQLLPIREEQVLGHTHKALTGMPLLSHLWYKT